MSKYVIDSETLEGLGNAIRAVTGLTRRLTPEEMIAEVEEILNATTFILVDKDGNEYPAAYVDSDLVFTATPNDIRKGYTAITAEGPVVGEKEIPNYRAQEGSVIVRIGKNLDIRLYSDMCEYTTLQAIICNLADPIENSVSAQKVVLDNNVYNVNSTNSLSVVTVKSDTQTIKLGLINDTDENVTIRYMIIKEDE